MRGAVTLAVDPACALFDRPVAIRATGLPLRGPVCLRARVMRWDGRWWHARAAYVADRAGCVDLTRDAPTEGSYEGIDGMGLFWSMAPEGEAATPPPIGPAHVHFSAEVDGAIVAEAVVERRWLADGATRRDVREWGLVGMLCEPGGSGPHPGVLVLHGSTPRLRTDIGQLLAGHGFAALALQYFGAEGLPPGLSGVPIEYFETALEWLSAQPRVRPEPFGVVGHSRGGELALVLGALIPRIRAVVAYAPSHVAWAPRRAPAPSAWTYRGKPVPAMPPGARSVDPPGAPCSPDVPFALAPGFLAALEDRSDEERARIPVERIDGPVMLISGTEDATWPSSFMAARVVERLRAHGHPHPVENLVYRGAGHTIGPPYAPPVLAGYHSVAQRVYAFGGNPRDCAHADADSWPRVIRFLRESLG